MVDGDETADEEFQVGARQVRKKRSPANAHVSVQFSFEKKPAVKDIIHRHSY
jgi:hypothetical protein